MDNKAKVDGLLRRAEEALAEARVLGQKVLGETATRDAYNRAADNMTSQAPPFPLGPVEESIENANYLTLRAHADAADARAEVLRSELERAHQRAQNLIDEARRLKGLQPKR